MYLLDTNVCIFLIKNKYPILKQKILLCNPDEIFLSTVTLAEMEYGAFKRRQYFYMKIYLTKYLYQ